jgi:glycosyltransferase involved in cell wall biosynthesis
VGTKTIAVIPAHNEEATVGGVVAGALRHVAAVVVVDDASTDATGERAREAGADVTRLDPNVGKGAALERGLDRALDLGADVVVTMDADGEHVPDDLPALLAALEDADLVTGFRDVYRTGMRKRLNQLALFWFRVLDPEIRDTICGFRAFRADALAAVRNQAGGFAYEHEVLLRAILAGKRLAAVPIRTSPTASTHVTPREIVRANNQFDRWVLAHLRQLPIAFWRKALLTAGCTAGLVWGVPAAWWLERGRKGS